MSEPISVQIDLPPDVVEQIAQRVAEILADRVQDERVEWLTLEQAAERLGCTAEAVRMRANRGRLERRSQGRRVYVRAADVDRLGVIP
jgi:excisionase family DNA binding protein